MVRQAEAEGQGFPEATGFFAERTDALLVISLLDVNDLVALT
jgi:hypothetical protein